MRGKKRDKIRWEQEENGEKKKEKEMKGMGGCRCHRGKEENLEKRVEKK